MPPVGISFCGRHAAGGTSLALARRRVHINNEHDHAPRLHRCRVCSNSTANSNLDSTVTGGVDRRRRRRAATADERADTRDILLRLAFRAGAFPVRQRRRGVPFAHRPPLSIVLSLPRSWRQRHCSLRHPPAHFHKERRSVFAHSFRTQIASSREYPLRMKGWLCPH